MAELSSAGVGLRVFLVDDHEIVRRGFASVLAERDGFFVVGESGTRRDAVERIPRADPDVVVLDVRLPDGDGISVCREIMSVCPEVRCLIVTSFADDEALLASIMAGASGYLLKQASADELVNAVRTVGCGGSLLDPMLAGRLIERLQKGPFEDDERLATLTKQERRILALIADGLSNREIAEQVFLAEATVKNYVSNILAKLGLARRTQAALLANELKRKRIA
jgi:DNA-binding NarL/FixJ family response regulator